MKQPDVIAKSKDFAVRLFDDGIYRVLPQIGEPVKYEGKTQYIFPILGQFNNAIEAVQEMNVQQTALDASRN